jgi:membrane-associated protein
MIVLVVAAAIIGDTVGYELGRLAGPRLLSLPALAKHQEHVDEARGLLARRGLRCVLRQVRGVLVLGLVALQ